MIVGFVQAAPPLIVVVVWTLILIFGGGYTLGEMMRLAQGKQPLWKKALLFPVRVVGARINKMVEKLVARASHQFVLASPAIARMLHRIASRVEVVSGELLQLSVETYQTFDYVRRTMTPTLIERAVSPLRTRLDQAFALAQGTATTLTQVSTEIATGLRGLPWGAPQGLPARVRNLMGAINHLWDQFFDITQPRVNELWNVRIPAMLERIEALERGAVAGIGAQVAALRNRVSDLERWRESVAMPRLDALADAVDLLSDQVFGPVAGGLTALLERIGEIERQLREDIADRFTELELGLAELRLDLEEGIRTGLEAFRSRIEALETEVFQVIPATLAAMQLAIDTLAQEVFDEVGAGLTTLTARIIAIEQEIQNRILPGFDAILGRIDALEAQIRDDILPRIRALEDILAPAAFAALVMATLRTSAPYLFCRNVVTSATEACAAPEDRIDDLLAAAFLLIGSISIIELARELQAITGVSAAAIDEWVIED